MITGLLHAGMSLWMLRRVSPVFRAPLRASVPLVAGIVEMPRAKFQLANWSSAFLWAFVLLMFGDAMGQGLNQLRQVFGSG